MLQIAPVDLAELAAARIDVLAELERLQHGALVDDLLKSVPFELTTLVINYK